MTGFEPATSGLTGRRERPSFTTPPNGDRLSLRRERKGGAVLEASGQVGDQPRAARGHRIAVTEKNLLVRQSGEFLNRSQRFVMIGAELRIRGGDASLGTYQGITRHQYLRHRIEQTDMTGGVAGSADHVEAKDTVTIDHGGKRPRSSNAVEVAFTGVAGGKAGGFQHRRSASLVVGMSMGQDDMADLFPSQTHFSQRRLDIALASGDAGIDYRRLASPHNDVGRDEAEIDPPELSLSGR